VKDAAEEFKQRIENMVYRDQIRRAVIIDHFCDQLRDAAAKDGAEVLVAAVADAREGLMERFDGRRQEGTSEAVKQQVHTEPVDDVPLMGHFARSL
jgi:hypothetical protein